MVFVGWSFAIKCVIGCLIIGISVYFSSPLFCMENVFIICFYGYILNMLIVILYQVWSKLGQWIPKVRVCIVWRMVYMVVIDIYTWEYTKNGKEI